MKLEPRNGQAVYIYESNHDDEYTYKHIKHVLSGYTTMSIDFNKLVGIGGESLVAAQNGDQHVIKIIEIMAPYHENDEDGRTIRRRQEDGNQRKGEMKSSLVNSRNILKPESFVIQTIGDRTFYLFRTYARIRSNCIHVTKFVDC